MQEKRIQKAPTFHMESRGIYIISVLTIFSTYYRYYRIFLKIISRIFRKPIDILYHLWYNIYSQEEDLKTRSRQVQKGEKHGRRNERLRDDQGAG